MIITCPRCAAQYAIAAESLGTRGRTVRCSNCGTLWTQVSAPDPAVASPAPDQARREALERVLKATGASPPAPPQPAAGPAAPGTGPERPAAEKPEPPPDFTRPMARAGDAAVAREPESDAGAAAPSGDVAPARSLWPQDNEPAPASAPPSGQPAAPGTTPGSGTRATVNPGAAEPLGDQTGALTVDEARLAYVPPPPGRRRRLSWGVIGAAAGSILIVLVAGLYLGRAFIVDVFPAAASIYAAMGISAQALGEGLDIRDVHAQRNRFGAAEAIVVTGSVENIGKVVRTVPPVRVTLFDPDDEPLRHTVVAVSEAPLDVGGTVSFSATLVDPPPLARRIKVTFAPPGAVSDDPGNPSSPPAGAGGPAAPGDPGRGH